MNLELVIAVFAGVGGMLGWGLADFFAKKTINEVGDVVSLTWAHIFGSMTLLFFALYEFFFQSKNFFFQNNLQTWALLIFFGVLQAIVYLLVYSGFSKGQVALLSPIFSSFSGFTAAISILLLGEVVNHSLLLGLFTLFVGIFLINLDQKALSTQRLNLAYVPGFKEIGCATILAVVWTLSWDKFISGRDWLTYDNLYKKNIEVVAKNKTLSLLSKLYEISILTLEPKDLGLRLAKTVLVELSLELVGIYMFQSNEDSLVPLALSESERMKSVLSKLPQPFDGITITGVSQQSFFKKTVDEKQENITNDVTEAWGKFIDAETIKSLETESHIKTTLLLPLSVESKMLGVIMLALNREYKTLNAFEQEAIRSFVNVVALALQKAFLYKELENANIKLRELDRQKDAVVHMVAHQFKGPVTTINFVTELLLDGTYGQLSDEQIENINTVRKASQKMGLQSEMVLDAAKITSGKLPLEPGPVDLNELFKEVVAEAENHAKEKKVHLSVTLPAEKLPTAILDKKYLQLAIDNLLSNAVKYTALKSKGGNVEFIVELKENTLFCTVKDSGIGIPKADQENIFKELYRASNAGKDGNGLGLHVAMGAIEAQGGKIHFESEEGRGTTFYVQMPLKLS